MQRTLAEWPLLKVRRSVATQDPESKVSVAAIHGLIHLTDCNQPNAANPACGFSAAAVARSKVPNDS